MTGLIKQKQYDWKDSNLALFGSDVEKNVKKESAASEPAWKGAGSKVGLKIWRIVKFKVTEWPREDYGNFYNGDSYIILNTYKEEGGDELCYDVHFWIGQYSTQDEYGTAAYKTVELDTLLDDKPIQYREVQGHESELFKSYFDNITIWKGGADTGFRHVKAEEYQPRLLHFCGNRAKVVVTEVPRTASRLNSDDVFILDLGKEIYQWNGSGSNKDERMKAMQYCIKLKSDRNGRATSEVLEEESTSKDHEFYKALDEDDVEDEAQKYEAADKEKELYRLSDASGSMEFSLAKKGSVSLADFDSKDVFILDTKNSLFVWVGKGTSVSEKKNAMSYAHKYLQGTDHPFVPISCLAEGKKQQAFETALAA